MSQPTVSNPPAVDPTALLTCRFCGTALEHRFADLGVSPLCESFVRPEDLLKEERFFPLTAYVCANCLLVQVPEFESPEAIFSDYAYFSSYSDSWLEHARRYSEMAIERFGLGPESFVVELASNDGYLLRNFVAAGIPCLGIDPAANVAEVARAQGVPTLTAFFGTEVARRLAAEGKRADLIVANNVLAHTPALMDFVAGIAALLAPQGSATLEFPHLLRLIAENQFDTIYHEHFSYFSLLSVEKVFAAHQLQVYDVEELPTHGGSLRIYARHAAAPTGPDSAGDQVSERLLAVRAAEAEAGLEQLDTYLAFNEQVVRTKHALLRLLLELKAQGKRIVGYGAPGKGNTLLNYCGIREDFLDYTVDRNPHKHGLYLPGTRIPIFAPEKIFETKPDYVMILPWNLKDEITAQLAGIRDWGGRFILPIPEATVL